MSIGTATDQQSYSSEIVWTGNTGKGTHCYGGYTRTWSISTPGKPAIHCSNDPMLGGDPSLHNPEDLLLSAVSACHMLWYLHLASAKGIVVTGYTDTPIGLADMAPNGAGQFIGITLRPTITLTSNTCRTSADSIHQDIHQYCFIARSIKAPVRVDASYSFDDGQAG
jgi:organic hydroperoxide reductase OsmC/OhrA